MRTTILMLLCAITLLSACTIPTGSGPTPQHAKATTTVAAPTRPTVRLTATASATATATPTSTASPMATATPKPTPTPPMPLVAIDPGHGGRDLGARHFDDHGHMDLYESQVNLELALRLRALLQERGYGVIMTRDDDFMLNPKRKDLNEDGIVDHADELQMRVDLINQAGADLLLSIHQNAFYWEDGEPAEEVGGTVTFYCADRDFGDENERLALLVQQHIVSAFRELGYDVNDRGIEPDKVLEVPGEPGKFLIVLGPHTDRIARPSEMPGVLSETLFITNREEAKLARQPEVLDRLAVAYAEAIEAFFAGVAAD